MVKRVVWNYRFVLFSTENHVVQWQKRCTFIHVTSWQRRVPEENSMLTTSASVKRRLSSEHLQSQNYRGMTTTCCPGSNRSFWWGFAPVITDWTVICTVNWSWHPRQLTPVVEKSRPWSMFYKDAPFTKPQEKTCGLSALPWRPNSTAASRSWRRRRHSSPERSLDRVDCERQEEEKKIHVWISFSSTVSRSKKLSLHCFVVFLLLLLLLFCLFVVVLVCFLFLSFFVLLFWFSFMS